MKEAVSVNLRHSLFILPDISRLSIYISTIYHPGLLGSKFGFNAISFVGI